MEANTEGRFLEESPGRGDLRDGSAVEGLPAYRESQSLSPSTYVGWLKTTCNSSSREV